MRVSNVKRFKPAIDNTAVDVYSNRTLHKGSKMPKDWKKIALQRLNENRELRRWIKKNSAWDRKCHKETVAAIMQIQMMQEQINKLLTEIQTRADVGVRYPEKIPG